MKKYKSKKINFSLILCFILSFVFLFLNFLNIVNPVLADDSGGGVFCNSVYGGALRPGIQPRMLRNAELFPDLGNRTYTLEELFSSNLGMSEFYGENDGKLIFGKRDAGLSGQVSGDAQKRIERRGEEVSGCLTTPIKNLISTGLLSVTSNINGITSFLVTSLFDPQFPTTSDGTDSSLVKIVGGENNQGGIVGEIASTVYFPLLGLAAIATGGYLLYLGIFKRQFRDAFKKVIWVFFALLIGLAIAIRPTTMTKLPHTVTAGVVGCVVDAMNGGNCLDSRTGSQKSKMIDKVCASDSASASISQQAALNVNALSCGIWKSLTLNSWSRAQFGYNFDELYTKNPPAGAKTYDLGSSGASPDAFCVGTHSSSSISQLQMSSTPSEMSGEKVCNIAAAQLSIQSGMNPDENNDLRNSIAMVAANDPIMFNNWGYSLGGISSSLESLLGTMFALLSIIIVTIRGHMYSFLATISMAFAPLFALLAIHPGKGRKMFLGWLENMVGYILKYIFSAIMVLITIMLFSALLTNMKGGFSAVVASLVLSISMMSYQRQFVDFVSKTNFGGAKVANSLGDVMDSKLDGVASATKKASMLSSGTLLGEKVSAMKNGTKANYGGAMADMLKREAAKSKNPLLRNTAQQMRRADNKFNKDIREAEREAKEAQRFEQLMDKAKTGSDAVSNEVAQLGENLEVNEKLQAVVPDLMGMDYKEAKGVLEASRLTLGSVTPSKGTQKGQTTEGFSGAYESKGSGDAQVGQIIGQSLNAGARAQSGTAINITVLDDGTLDLSAGSPNENLGAGSLNETIMSAVTGNAKENINSTATLDAKENVNLTATSDGVMSPADIDKYIEKFGEEPKMAPLDANGKVLDGFYAMTPNGYKWQMGLDPNALAKKNFFSIDGKSMSLDKAKDSSTKEYAEYLKRYGQEPLRNPASLGAAMAGGTGGRFERTSQGYRFNNAIEGNPTSTKLVIDNLKYMDRMERYGLDANLARERAKGALTEADRERIKQTTARALAGNQTAMNLLDKNIMMSQFKDIYDSEFKNNPELSNKLDAMVLKASNGDAKAVNALNKIDSVNELKYPKDGNTLTHGDLANIESQKAQIVNDYTNNPEQFSKGSIGKYQIEVTEKTLNSLNSNNSKRIEMPDLNDLNSTSNVRVGAMPDLSSLNLKDNSTTSQDLLKDNLNRDSNYGSNRIEQPQRSNEQSRIESNQVWEKEAIQNNNRQRIEQANLNNNSNYGSNRIEQPQRNNEEQIANNSQNWERKAIENNDRQRIEQANSNNKSNYGSNRIEQPQRSNEQPRVENNQTWEREAIQNNDRQRIEQVDSNNNSNYGSNRIEQPQRNNEEQRANNSQNWEREAIQNNDRQRIEKANSNNTSRNNSNYGSDRIEQPQRDNEQPRIENNQTWERDAIQNNDRQRIEKANSNNTSRNDSNYGSNRVEQPQIDNTQQEVKNNQNWKKETNNENSKHSNNSDDRKLSYGSINSYFNRENLKNDNIDPELLDMSNNLKNMGLEDIVDNDSQSSISEQPRQIGDIDDMLDFDEEL